SPSARVLATASQPRPPDGWRHRDGFSSSVWLPYAAAQCRLRNLFAPLLARAPGGFPVCYINLVGQGCIMRRGLTRRLSGLLLMLSLGVAVPLQASEVQLSGEEQARYLAELKRLYLTGNERQALLAHSNALLDTYA